MITFQNKQVVRYQAEAISPETLEEDFNLIDSFFEQVKGYIYTEIWMSDHTQPIEVAFRSRLKILMSSTLYRSLMLKDGIVQALNDGNFPSYYAGLKSFMEIVGVLGYLCDLIYREEDFETLTHAINTLSLGNRDSGIFPRGNVEAISVMTMLTKADREFMKLLRSGGDQPELGTSTPITDSYSDICNFGHPNYNSLLATGKLEPSTRVWKAKLDASGYKTGLYPFYMHAFTTSISAMLFFCSRIVRNSKVNSFEGTTGVLLFS
jgi:hypothetical protein